MSGAEMIEERIRERAYHIWEASGRPSGRDQEFWHQARQQIAVDERQAGPKAKARAPKQAATAQPARKRSRKTTQPSVSQASAPPA